MKNHPGVIFLLSKSLEPNVEKSLYQQIYDNLREAILERRLRVGKRLPSTRLLAEELGVSRNTVMNAFDQLIAEGYLVGKQGAGTYVAEQLPDELLRSRIKKSEKEKTHTPKPSISKRAKKISKIPFRFSPNSDKPLPFSLGIADVKEFPIDIWTRLITRNLKKMSSELLSYGGTLGYFPLRQTVADYFSDSRGVRCDASQVLIISGSQHGLDLTSRILLNEGDEVLIEDPNYTGMHGALLAGGAKIIPVPLDKEGIDLEKSKKLSIKPRAAYITPSSHFPTGIIMSLARRLEILEWAEQKNAWIIEDDYSSEFRYKGKPLAALQGIDMSDRVIYIGTFSKILFPALRLGYLVLPPDLVNAFQHAIAFTTRQPSILEQTALNDFIKEGHFGRHVKRMRGIYFEKRKYLIGLIEKELGNFIEIEKNNSGMHIIGLLKNGQKDSKFARVAMEHGVYTSPMSGYCIDQKLPDALLFGFTAIKESEMRKCVAILKKAWLNYC